MVDEHYWGSLGLEGWEKGEPEEAEGGGALLQSSTVGGLWAGERGWGKKEEQEKQSDEVPWPSSSHSPAPPQSACGGRQYVHSPASGRADSPGANEKQAEHCERTPPPFLPPPPVLPPYRANTVARWQCAGEDVAEH